jgi:hypothetical protein
MTPTSLGEGRVILPLPPRRPGHPGTGASGSGTRGSRGFPGSQGRPGKAYYQLGPRFLKSTLPRFERKTGVGVEVTSITEGGMISSELHGKTACPGRSPPTH